MKIPAAPLFLIIDDNAINNNICKMVIEKTIPDVTVHTFTEPETGLSYINIAYLNGEPTTTILLLDINMPTINGWEVLDQFENFPDYVKDKFTIYMLSSSVTLQDKIQAEEHPLVTGYIEKPLTMLRLKQILLE